MSYIVFDDSLRVGNKLIDQEHAVLIEYINLLQRAMENETSDTIIKQVLDGLVDYTKTHFFLEEELMKAYEYPGQKQHLQAHKSFVAKLDELQHQYKDKDEKVTGSVLDFLKDWLKNHILKVDAELSAFMKDKRFA